MITRLAAEAHWGIPLSRFGRLLPYFAFVMTPELSSLLIQLVLASGMVVITVIIHLIGLAVLVRTLRARSWHPLFEHIRPITLLIGASIGIFAIHTVEIWLFAALYVLLAAMPDFEQSLYFSTLTYTTVGYGDVVLGKSWRVLGAIEGATGIIMLGWSTAFLVSLLAQSKLLRHDWLTPESEKGEIPPGS